LLLVQFRSCAIDEFVEVRALEARIVPLGVGDIGGGIARILGRPATPIGGAERLRVPDLGPVAIARFAAHIDLDTRLACTLLKELGRIDRAGKGSFRSAQHDRPLMAGLLVVEGSLFRIIDALLYI